MISYDTSQHPYSPSRPRSATTTDIPHMSSSATPTITAIPPSPALIPDFNFSVPTLAPLNLSVLTEEPQPGNGAGKLLTDELERILVGFSGILDVVGNGLTILETKSRPADKVNIVNGDIDLGNVRESNNSARDRLDSLTNAFTAGGTIVRRG